MDLLKKIGLVIAWLLASAWIGGVLEGIFAHLTSAQPSELEARTFQILTAIIIYLIYRGVTKHEKTKKETAV